MKMILILTIALNAGFANAHTYWGPKVSIARGHARSFVETNEKGITELGAAISHDGLSGLSMEMEEYVLPLPTNVQVYPYKHITLDWNPHGHEPENVYTKPHFDFHFYFISNAARLAISCMNQDAQVCTKEPGADYVAAKYAPTPAGVPKMGWHWVDLLAPEFNGGNFTRTFIYGYYDGAMIFVEPMVTLEYLKNKTYSVNKVRQPALFPYQGGMYPTHFKTSYDSKTMYHKVVLTQFQ